jgi:Fur family transcriptional regulator, ferric uptake regulator
LPKGGDDTGDKKFRMTEQRRIILDELEKTYQHPSAADVYEKVKQRLPHISLGTVYRNLEILSSRGIISKLSMSSGQKRFDAWRGEHHHIRCLSCGRVDDLPHQADENLEALVARMGDTSGYKHMGFAVDFFGTCPECSGRKTRKEKKHG